MPSFERDKFLAHDRAAAYTYAHFIEGFLRRYFSDDNRVADAMQSALLQLVTKLQTAKDLSQDEMVRLVSNCAQNALRRQLTQMRRRVVEFESQLHTPSAAEQERHLHQRDELDRVERLLEQYGERDLLVLIARVQGYSNQEIAEEYGLTEGAVRTAAWRLRKKLRLELSTEQARAYRVERIHPQRGSSAVATC